MTGNETLADIDLGLIGSTDFCRRIGSGLLAHKTGLRTHPAGYAEAWGMLSSSRPNVLLIEVGRHYSARIHAWARSFLEQLRDRYAQQVYVALALSAPESLGYGGDLLFANDDTFAPSGYIDALIVAAPADSPSSLSLSRQAMDVLRYYQVELLRRRAGKKPLPPLGGEGWAQSMADPASRELWMKWLPRYASYTNENPIIIGETGTGKTNLALALHILAGLPGKFISITPRDFSSSELVQGELFGAVEGAYTGAVEKWGLVHSAEKGTLFIDEPQSIDKDLQGKLITFIENKVYRRVGSSASIEADVRFVFASNQPLQILMESNVLRDDFAYRLERMQLELPPLHKRPLDIPAALAYALAKIKRQRLRSRPIFGLTPSAYRMLFCATWPGNLRQLENNAAKLCELTDMRGEQIIEADSIAELLSSRLSGSPMSGVEVIAAAGRALSSQALKCGIHSVDQGVGVLIELARIGALEASGGDPSTAAALIEDHEKLLELTAKGIMAKLEVELIKQHETNQS